MTDHGSWGNGSPQHRPDDPESPDNPGGNEGATTPDRDAGPAHSYGAPTYGAPSYSQQSYGQQSYGQPGQQQPSYEPPTQQYAAPSYQQPTGGGYGGYSPPQDTQPTQAVGYGYQGTATQPGQPVAYGQYGPNGAGTPPEKKRSGAKIGLIIGVVVVLVAGLGVGAWALWFRGGPAVTWQGKEVANPEAVLTEAQNDLTTLVTDTKGVKGSDTRCYFAVAKNPPKDTPKTDVGDTVYCGPALFVDGDTNKPFIPYGIAAGSGSGDKITLSVSTKGTEAGATSVPADKSLVRPDGASAPDGAGGLAVPEPPPADADVFVAVDGVDVPDAPAGATMASLNGGVTIEKLGEIKRYGSGSDARSAPEGQKLIAFALGEAAGDGGSDGPSVLKLTVSVDGGAGKAIPDLSTTNVIAVPTDAKSVDLVTSADSAKQTLSLLTGKPGTGNIAVLARTNRFGSFTPPTTFSFTETGGGASAPRACTLSGSVAGLFYWADDKGTAHAAAPSSAILETDLKYTFSTDSPPPFTGSKAGDSATFEPAHLVLTLPGGQKIQAKTVGDRTVFEVAASFTEGTITVGGAFTNSNGITFTVAAPVSFKVSIPTS